MTWQEAKNQVDALTEFPEVTDIPRKHSVSSHDVGDINHQTNIYEIPYNVGEWEGLAVWSACTECPEDRRIRFQYVVVFNNDRNSCFRKDFYKRGKQIV